MTVGESFLRRVTTVLEAAGVAYMVAGSLGSSLFGQARATNDADIIIAPTAEQLPQVVDGLSDYYVSASAAAQAFRNQSMFNVIDVASGSKADLILLKNRPFSREEFSRRIQATVLGVPVYMGCHARRCDSEQARMVESRRIGASVSRRLRDRCRTI